MVNLKNVSGLDIEYNDEERILDFGENVINVEPSKRVLADAKDVLISKNIELDDDTLYLMYRGISNFSDAKILADNNLRYDITVIYSLALGKEFNKTIGHYHSEIAGTGMTFPEIYEVLQGKAHCLLQKVDFSDLNNQKVEDVLMIEAKVGDKVIIPPGYGHITINPSHSETLIMANITADGFDSIYNPISKAGGGVYFEKNNFEWVKNKNYLNTPSLRGEKYQNIFLFGLDNMKPMYTSLIENPALFAWLCEPKDYKEQFEKIIQ